MELETDSEWQTAKTKRKTKTIQPPISMNTSSSGFKVIPVGIIMQYESIYVDVTRELSNKFDEINKMLLTSTQWQDSKINHNIHNHNRWKLSNTDNNDIAKILGSFNKLTNMNFDIIAEEIKGYNIINITELNTLVNNIYLKCIGNFQFVPVNIKMIKKIIMEFGWIVHDESSRTVTFRKYFINYLENNFEKIMNKVTEPIDEDDENLVSAINEERTTFMKILCALYDNHIIGTQLTRYIFTTLENAYVKNNKSGYIEMWLILFKCAKNHWIGDNAVYILEQHKFIDNNRSKFGIRINILVDMALSDEIVPTMVQDSHDKKEKGHEYDIDILIDSHGEYDNVIEWCESLTDLDDHELVIDDIIDNLICRTTDLKVVFTMLKHFMSMNDDYKKKIKNGVRKTASKSNNKSYITNAGIILK